MLIKEILIAEICNSLRSANVRNVERAHVALLPKWLTTYFSAHFSEIKRAFGVLLFLFLSFGLNAQNKAGFISEKLSTSFVSHGAVLLNKIDSLSFFHCSISREMDTIWVADNPIPIKVERLYGKDENRFLSFTNVDGKNGVAYFDSEGLTAIKFYHKRGRVSIYAVNMVDAIAEWENSRE